MALNISKYDTAKHQKSNSFNFNVNDNSNSFIRPIIEERSIDQKNESRRSLNLNDFSVEIETKMD